MIYTYPDYYKRFNCIADKCPDTCCGKWQIVIDDDSLEKYQEYDGEYRPELHRRVNWSGWPVAPWWVVLAGQFVLLDLA